MSRWLVDFAEEVEADLAWRYPRDADQLEAFWDGRMSWRRLWVLVSQLPRDAATVIAELGPERAAWSTEVELLARAVDELTIANWQFASAHRGKAPPPPDPELVPRPFDEPGR